MNVALLGGDGRSVRLSRLLQADGHRVRTFALEQELDSDQPSVEHALAGAEAVILPLPCQRDGVLNAPLSHQRLPLLRLLPLIPRGTPVFAGQAGPITELCRELGLPLGDYFAREELAVANADLTAEGAVGVLLEELPVALAGSRVLIVGFGRIGRLLALKLRALGCAVTVMARSGEARAWAKAMGCRGMEPGAAQPWEGFDAVVNTVPATLFGPEELPLFGDALLLELASPPYGFDGEAARALGKRLVFAPGLPGITAPQSAAEAVRDTIYAMLKEVKP